MEKSKELKPLTDVLQDLSARVVGEMDEETDLNFELEFHRCAGSE